MDTNKHILIISQYFYPEQFRINDIASEFVKRGYKVSVLTGIPNYPEGRFYKGYSWFTKRKEEYNGINIIRIPLIARGKSTIGLAANYLSFVFFGFFWAHFTKLKADFVFSFEVSPMTQVKVGCWFSKRIKVPHYLYVQDLWPENVEVISGIHNPLIINPIRRMVNRIYRQCTRIFATSPSFVDDIKACVKEKDKVFFLPQYAEDFYKPVEKEFARLEATKYGISDDATFKLIFTGNIGFAQGLDILPKVAKLAKNEGIHDIRMVIVGEGRYHETLLTEIKTEKLEDYFIFIPKQHPETIPMLLSSCDAAFVSFADNNLWKKTIPAKLQSYMACGMPIIAAAEGEVTRIIAESKAGMSCSFGNEKKVLEMIIEMKNTKLSEISQNAYRYSEEHFNKQKIISSLLEMINS